MDCSIDEMKTSRTEDTILSNGVIEETTIDKSDIIPITV